MADLLRAAKPARDAAPVLAVGHRGLWGALREVFPDSRPQGCQFQKAANTLVALRQSANPAAKKALAEILSAQDNPCLDCR